jgi:hypothetical protein
MVAEIMAEVGLDPAMMEPLSARILGRAAPAHRHRPRDDPAARSWWCWTSRPAALDMTVQVQIVDLLRAAAQMGAGLSSSSATICG